MSIIRSARTAIGNCLMATPRFLFLLSLIFPIAYSGLIGVNYGGDANNLPSPSDVVALLKSNGIRHLKLFDSGSAFLTALSNTGISVIVGLPNDQLSSAAAAQSFTDQWVQTNIVPYHTTTTIEAIAVGNEVFDDPQNTAQYLVQAINNVYASLVKYNLASIHVSTPVSISALATTFPSSKGAFKSELIQPYLIPIFDFVRKTGSHVMLNAYAFFPYEYNPTTFSLDYALFRDNNGVMDPNNGLIYKSLFEAQLDAVYTAMTALQYNDIKMVITETGWPSKGDANETGAGIANAAAYNGNLVHRVLTGGGTPLRPNDPLNVYIFALFNEDLKPGPTSERNFGLFYPNEQKVYDISFTG